MCVLSMEHTLRYPSGTRILADPKFLENFWTPAFDSNTRT